MSSTSSPSGSSCWVEGDSDYPTVAAGAVSGRGESSCAMHVHYHATCLNSGHCHTESGLSSMPLGVVEIKIGRITYSFVKDRTTQSARTLHSTINYDNTLDYSDEMAPHKPDWVSDSLNHKLRKPDSSFHPKSVPELRDTSTRIPVITSATLIIIIYHLNKLNVIAPESSCPAAWFCQSR